MNRYVAWTLTAGIVTLFLTSVVAQPDRKMADVVNYDARAGTTIELSTDAIILATSDSWFALEAEGAISAPEKVDDGFRLTLVEALTHSHWQVYEGTPRVVITPINDFNYVDVMIGSSTIDQLIDLGFLWCICFVLWFLITAAMMEIEEKT